ncbi:hypothetical protein NQZ68_032483 [Dissostichus eleginoides]|nr:hypothetical protein NQZ68_032483 [Dissostichus eleginoides]
MFVHVLVLRVLLLHWTTQRGLTSLFEALLKSVTKFNVTKLYRNGTVRLISFHDKRPTSSHGVTEEGRLQDENSNK